MCIVIKLVHNEVQKVEIEILTFFDIMNITMYFHFGYQKIKHSTGCVCQIFNCNSNIQIGICVKLDWYDHTNTMSLWFDILGRINLRSQIFFWNSHLTRGCDNDSNPNLFTFIFVLAISQEP